MDRARPHLITIALLAFAAVPPVADSSADQVFLRGGGRVSGVIVERTPRLVVIETAPGRVTLPMARVEKVVEGRSALIEFRERAAQIKEVDAAGWTALARWASDRDLFTQAREAWRRVLAIDPSHSEANAAIGRVAVGGVWMEAEDGYRARGLVSFEGRWVTPAEHEALVRERALDSAAVREQREAQIRVREAEARVREAEARAREAEEAATETGGIPMWWGSGGSVIVPPFGYPPYGVRLGVGHRVGPHERGSRTHVRPTEPAPVPTPTPAPPSLRPPPAPRQAPAALGPTPTREPQRH